MGEFVNKVKKLVGIRSGRIAKNWDFNTNSSLLAAPTVADINGDGKQSIIIGTKGGEIIVLDSLACEVWKHKIQEDMDPVEEMFIDQEIQNSINSSPTLADITGDGKQNILFGTEQGVVYCLSNLGDIVWKHNTKGGVRGSVLVADVNNDGKLEVIFGSTDNYLYILNNNGNVIERFEQSSSIESNPAFFKDKIFFGTDDGKIISLFSNGEIFWEYQTGDKITATPVFAKIGKNSIECVIVGSTDNKLYCFDLDGELLWSFETGGAIYSKVSIIDLNNDGKLEIIFGSCDNNVYAINEEGEKIWSYETNFWVVSTPLIADIDNDGKLEVVVGSYDHNIYVLDSEGEFLLDYVPGLSGVVQQAGHYSDILTQETGQHVGKKIWQFKADGVVIGCAKLNKSNSIIVGTKTGIIDNLVHKV